MKRVILPTLVLCAELIVVLPLFAVFVVFRRQFLEGYLNSGIK